MAGDTSPEAMTRYAERLFGSVPPDVP